MYPCLFQVTCSGFYFPYKCLNPASTAKNNEAKVFRPSDSGNSINILKISQHQDPLEKTAITLSFEVLFSVLLRVDC